VPLPALQRFATFVLANDRLSYLPAFVVATFACRRRQTQIGNFQFPPLVFHLWSPNREVTL